MYYFFLDESGDDNFSNGTQGSNQGCSEYITVGGIIVKDSDIAKFDSQFNSIIQTYFNNISLPQKFKLHYTTLKRGQKFPYKDLQFEGRCNLSHEIFETVKNSNCELISCTINKKNHKSKYNNNAKNPKAYALLICVERFHQFLNEKGEKGIIIYEEFNHIRKKMKTEIEELLRFPTFPNYEKLKDVEKFINSGKPCKYPILQFADFIAHMIWLHKTKPNQIKDKFLEYENKFYNYNASTFFSGYVEL